MYQLSLEDTELFECENNEVNKASFTHPAVSKQRCWRPRKQVKQASHDTFNSLIVQDIRAETKTFMILGSV